MTYTIYLFDFLDDERGVELKDEKENGGIYRVREGYEITVTSMGGFITYRDGDVFKLTHFDGVYRFEQLNIEQSYGAVFRHDNVVFKSHYCG